MTLKVLKASLIISSAASVQSEGHSASEEASVCRSSFWLSRIHEAALELEP